MNFPHRRQFLHLAAGAAALPALSCVARAQTYPTRPVRLIVGFTPGSSPDIVSRIAAQWLSERLGQQFVIDNRPGAGGTIGADAVVRSAADGYTLLGCGIADATNSTIYDNLNFNFIRDIAPVAGLFRGAFVMVVNPSVPANTVLEFIDYAKANSRKINMASAGTGSGTHLAGELFKVMAGVDMVHVPYRGSGQALSDVLGGQVQVMFPAAVNAIEHIRAGRLRALAVTTATRSDALTDIPTVGDFVSGYEASAWFGIGAPKATPADIVAKLNGEINAALADAQMKARFGDLGGTAMAGTHADFGKLIAEETVKWGKVIRAANIKPE
jgi:tripartite-type tricarboxylate transporter receptor subunit TctC